MICVHWFCGLLLTFARLIPKETSCKNICVVDVKAERRLKHYMLLLEFWSEKLVFCTRMMHSVVLWKQVCWRFWCQTLVALRDSTLLCRLLPSGPFFIYKGPPLLFQCIWIEKDISKMVRISSMKHLLAHETCVCCPNDITSCGLQRAL